MKHLMITLFALWPSQVSAQSSCVPPPVMVERLAGGYGEIVIGRGFAPNGALIELYISEETGSWTVTATMPGGPSCMLITGEAWEFLPMMALEPNL